MSFYFIQIQAARDEMQWAEEGPPPLLVKIAPDLSKEDLEDIAAVCLCIALLTCSFITISPYYEMLLLNQPPGLISDYRSLLLFAWMGW